MSHPNEAELELLLKELLCRMPFTQTLGMELVRVEPDHVCIRIADLSKSVNAYGSIHGGAMLSLADTAAGFAAMTDGRHYVTQSCSFAFLANTSSAPFCADCRVLHRGQTVAVVEARILAHNQELLASGHFNMYSVDRPFLE